jgi:hypothetical protein
MSKKVIPYEVLEESDQFLKIQSFRDWQPAINKKIVDLYTKTRTHKKLMSVFVSPNNFMDKK